MDIKAIASLEDNYIWTLRQGSKAVVIDPGTAPPILAWLQDQALDLLGILLTHNHLDHVGGVAELRRAYPQAFVMGPQECEAYNSLTIGPGEAFELFGQKGQVIKTAGHTQGHITYVLDQEVFCGDALFLAGCGRVFTGDYQAAWEGIQTLKALPLSSRLYPAHEYSLTNLAFAQSQGIDLGDQLAKVQALLQAGQPSLPTTLATECDINPFVRAGTLDEFIRLRLDRDHFVSQSQPHKELI